jgi:hypothetical protein
LLINIKLQPRNINASFTNNSNVAVDLLIFTVYSDQLVVLNTLIRGGVV